MGSLTLFEGQRKRGRQIHVSIVESLYVQLFKGTSTSFNSTVQLLLWCHYRAQFGIRVLFGKTLLPPFPHFFHRSEKMSPQLLCSPNIRLVSTPLFNVTDKVKEVAVTGQCVTRPVWSRGNGTGALILEEVPSCMELDCVRCWGSRA